MNYVKGPFLFPCIFLRKALYMPRAKWQLPVSYHWKSSPAARPSNSYSTCNCLFRCLCNNVLLHFKNRLLASCKILRHECVFPIVFHLRYRNISILLNYFAGLLNNINFNIDIFFYIYWKLETLVGHFGQNFWRHRFSKQTKKYNLKEIIG